MNKEELIKFEDDIAKLFKEGKIRYPIHLSGDNEDQVIAIFEDYKKGDWVFSTWRNHYHWLLSGRSPKELKRQIMEHGSMHVYDDGFFTSAIVGGIAPIAVGVAWAIKRKGLNYHVWCFIGDMAASGGLFHESLQYAEGHDLPITFVIEDNELSVQTNTKEVWGLNKNSKIKKYKYHRKYPHAGMGEFVLF